MGIGVQLLKWTDLQLLTSFLFHAVFESSPGHTKDTVVVGSFFAFTRQVIINFAKNKIKDKMLTLNSVPTLLEFTYVYLGMVVSR